MVKAREELVYLARVMAAGGHWLLSAVGLVFLVVGGSVVGVVGAALHEPLGAVAALVSLVFVTAMVGAFRLHNEEDDRTRRLAARVRALEKKPPQLSFGKPVIQRQSQPMPIHPTSGSQFPPWAGRVIRVPVINGQGAGEARRVHGLLTFMPGLRDARSAPTHPVQAEWSEEGEGVVELDMPGNGRPCLLDVAVVVAGEYPHVHQWTRASRGAGLRGYAILARPVTVDIEVMTSGSAGLHDRLTISVDSGILSADWASRNPDEATNWVPWDSLRG
jgi:hypothetical protein